MKLDRQRLRRELAIRSGESLFRRIGSKDPWPVWGSSTGDTATTLPESSPGLNSITTTARLSLTFQIEAGDQELVNQLDTSC